jgi:hypothetical protein
MDWPISDAQVRRWISCILERMCAVHRRGCALKEANPRAQFLRRAAAVHPE